MFWFLNARSRLFVNIRIQILIIILLIDISARNWSLITLYILQKLGFFIFFSFLNISFYEIEIITSTDFDYWNWTIDRNNVCSDFVGNKLLLFIGISTHLSILIVLTDISTRNKNIIRLYTFNKLGFFIFFLEQYIAHDRNNYLQSYWILEWNHRQKLPVFWFNDDRCNSFFLQRTLRIEDYLVATNVCSKLKTRLYLATAKNYYHINVLFSIFRYFDFYSLLSL